ncbi:hypothetical protein B0H14DRAFT_3489433 [Mycena olivaceomarginata]|nr:hypothetical protein B0H14DRAFT_3489433 [Mycena olivaceomarginata]
MPKAKAQPIVLPPGTRTPYKHTVMLKARNWYLSPNGLLTRSIKNALDDTQYELKQRDRCILFAPTLTAATGFLHECPGFGPAFLQQHDGSFVRNPKVNIYFVVDWCLGSVYTSIADAEAAWMQQHLNKILFIELRETPTTAAMARALLISLLLSGMSQGRKTSRGPFDPVFDHQNPNPIIDRAASTRQAGRLERTSTGGAPSAPSSTSSFSPRRAAAGNSKGPADKSKNHGPSPLNPYLLEQLC